MGCGSSSDATATNPPRPPSTESNPPRHPSSHTASHSGSANTEDREQILADMLIARMLLHEEMEQLQMLSQANRRETTELRGLTEEEINTIGTVKVLETPDGSDDMPASPTAANPVGMECVMCLVEHCAGDSVRILNCHHMFHTECIDGWLQRNRTCPCCCRDVTVSLPMLPTHSTTKGYPGPEADGAAELLGGGSTPSEEGEPDELAVVHPPALVEVA